MHLQAFHRDDRLRLNQTLSSYHSFSGELAHHIAFRDDSFGCFSLVELQLGFTNAGKSLGIRSQLQICMIYITLMNKCSAFYLVLNT